MLHPTWRVNVKALPNDDCFPLFSCWTWQDVEIDIELAPGDQSAIPKTKEQAERDAGNQLHMLTNRHDKFLDSLREVKVRLIFLEAACTLFFSSEGNKGLTILTRFWQSW